MQKRMIVIGGGEIRNKTTIEIDRYIATLAKKRAKDRRAVATFVGTASHDSMPYFNSFRKTYTSVFDIKAEVSLSVYGEMDYEKIRSKFEIADCIYLGGGDTKYLMEHLSDRNILPLIVDAYNRGVIIAGLSAGGICWFDTMYSDCDIIVGASNDYKILDGLGVLKGVVCPHYNQRCNEFDPLFLQNGYKDAYAIEDDSAIEFVDGQLTGAITSGGKSYNLRNDNGSLIKTEIPILSEIELKKR